MIGPIIIGFIAREVRGIFGAETVNGISGLFVWLIIGWWIPIGEAVGTLCGSRLVVWSWNTSPFFSLRPRFSSPLQLAI